MSDYVDVDWFWSDWANSLCVKTCLAIGKNANTVYLHKVKGSGVNAKTTARLSG